MSSGSSWVYDEQVFILNQSNANPNNNNQFLLDFPQKLQINEDEQVAILNASIPYSWFNITNAFNNQSVSYIWPENGLTYTITFGNVFFQTSDINNYIQQVMASNGDYLINAQGMNVYYFNLVTNYTIYGDSITFTPLPATLPAGWSYPVTNPGYIANPWTLGNAVTLQLVTNSSNFATLIGLLPNMTYPATPQATTFIQNSVVTPEIIPVIGAFICTNLVNDPNQNTFGDVIYQFTPQVQFGSTVVILPPVANWYKCTAGFYQNLQITFTDSNHNPLGVNDTNAVITVQKRKKRLVQIKK